MSLTLTPAELHSLTGYRQGTKQREVLDELGIPWNDVRGRLVVLRKHAEAWAEGKPVRRSNEPRLDLVR